MDMFCTLIAYYMKMRANACDQKFDIGFKGQGQNLLKTVYMACSINIF